MSEKEISSPKIVQWFFARWRLLLKIVSAVIAVLCLVWGVALYLNYKREEGVKAYYQARQETDEAKRIEQLEAMLEHYGHMPATTFALMDLARLAEKRGEVEKAISAYTMLRERSHRQPLVYVAALHGLASIATAQAKHDEAFRYYTEAALSPRNAIKHESQFQQGLSLLRLEKREEAKKLFEEILATAKDNAFKKKVEDQILWLASHP